MSDNLLDLEDLNLEAAPRALLEKDIENAVCKYAVQRYGMAAEKFTSPARRSVPDRLFSVQCGDGVGRCFFVEFKRPGQKATPKQAADHFRRRQMGFHVFVVDSIEYGRELIDRMAKKWGVR